MEQIITISLVFGIGVLGAGVAIGRARRQVSQKRIDYRMGQALRRGLANPDGIRTRALPVVQWQACESTSAR